MHFPKNHEENPPAKRRVVFEGILLFQMRLQGLKKAERKQKRMAWRSAMISKN